MLICLLHCYNFTPVQKNCFHWLFFRRQLQTCTLGRISDGLTLDTPKSSICQQPPFIILLQIDLNPGGKRGVRGCVSRSQVMSSTSGSSRSGSSNWSDCLDFYKMWKRTVQPLSPWLWCSGSDNKPPGTRGNNLEELCKHYKSSSSWILTRWGQICDCLVQISKSEKPASNTQKQYL